ncbi:flavin-containing monooxygenase [Gordonia sp. (in: high G+C Gram-positive bacteria)]|uniref:flavin-containing monooxygenase n=1 Tax=Gordonia sp. (in: high G+C Gram-positive bacteria) TaxID=84139 RepID=UPI003C716D81
MTTTSPDRVLPDHADVLIVGAGISGIGMAYHLTQQPGRTFAMVDARDSIGGTWDFFKYPGLRSDSDLHTFMFSFKPWTSKNAIADAPEIMMYLNETVDELGLRKHLYLGQRVNSADFNSEEGRWHVELEHNGTTRTVTCQIFFSAAGYYSYDGGYTPEFPGIESFAGQVVHPQGWPEDLDYVGKRVVVIGSGATAVTIVPAMAENAGHVTMLQRSPSYVLSLPRQDPIANGLRAVLPERLAYRLTRRFNTFKGQAIYYSAQRWPNAVRKLIRKLTANALPEGYPVDTHFNPTYNPWDERLCLIPDGDFFGAISSGRASIVTDRIASFDETGILLESGDHLDADIVVTATGLNTQAFGGIEYSIDGEPIDISQTVAYKSMMLSGVPNFAFTIGYTNLTWTLKVDPVGEHLCRLLDHMDRTGNTVMTPMIDPEAEVESLFDMQSGYLQRAAATFPRRGREGSWTMDQDFSVDKARLSDGPIEDPDLHFSAPAPTAAQTRQKQSAKPQKAVNLTVAIEEDVVSA